MRQQSWGGRNTSGESCADSTQSVGMLLLWVHSQKGLTWLSPSSAETPTMQLEGNFNFLHTLVTSCGTRSGKWERIDSVGVWEFRRCFVTPRLPQCSKEQQCLTWYRRRSYLALGNCRDPPNQGENARAAGTRGAGGGAVLYVYIFIYLRTLVWIFLIAPPGSWFYWIAWLQVSPRSSTCIIHTCYIWSEAPTMNRHSRTPLPR